MTIKKCWQDSESGNQFAIVTATEGLNALLKIEAAQEGFDLVITDVGMPNIGGIGIISLIKQRQPSIPIIAITGTFAPPEHSAQEANANVILAKPFDLNKPIKWIKILLAEKMGD